MDKNTLIYLANMYYELTNLSFEIVCGKNKKEQNFILNFKDSEFTHIIGFDHLPTIKNKIGKKSNLKAQFLHTLMNGNFNMSMFTKADLAEISKTISSTYNLQTQKGYSLNDRVFALLKLKDFMYMAYCGEFYEWNTSKSSIILPDGKNRTTRINADYLLKIPTENKGEQLYVFFCKENRTQKSDKIRLNAISAFVDCVDLTLGQNRGYAILKQDVYNIRKKEYENVYIRNNYIPNADKFSVSIQLPPTAYPVMTPKGTVAVSVDMPKPITVTLPIPPKLPFKEWFAKALNIIKGTFVSAKENLKSKKEAATTKEPSAKGEKQKNILTTNKATIHQQPQPEIVSIDDFDFIDTEEIATISENVAKAPLEPKQQEQASKENKRSGYSSFPTVNRPSDTKDTQSKERKKDNPSL